MDGDPSYAVEVHPTRKYDSCFPRSLGDGMLIAGPGWHESVQYFENIIFQSYCPYGVPSYRAIRANEPWYQNEPLVDADWARLLNYNDFYGRAFLRSIYSVTILCTTNYIITVFLTLLVFLTIPGSPHRIIVLAMKAGSVLATITLTVFLAKGFSTLQKEHDVYSSASPLALQHVLTNDHTCMALNFISTLIFQICQLSILARLYTRRREKQILITLGAMVIASCDLLWIVPRAASLFKHRNHTRWALILPFQYLLNIAGSTCYTSIVVPYVISKRHYWSHSLQLTFLSCLTIAVVALSPIFFVLEVIQEIYSTWIGIFSSSFNLSCVVIVWVWLDRIGLVKSKEQSQSILGRPIYEDEPPAKYMAQYDLHYKTSDSITTMLKTTPSWKDEKQLPQDHETNSSLMELQDAWKNPGSTETGTDINSIDSVRFNANADFRDRTIGVLKFLWQTFVESLTKSQKKMTSVTLELNSERERRKNVKKRLGLDREDDIFIYNTKDIVFDTEVESD